MFSQKERHPSRLSALHHHAATCGVLVQIWQSKAGTGLKRGGWEGRQHQVPDVGRRKKKIKYRISPNAGRGAANNNPRLIVKTPLVFVLLALVVLQLAIVPQISQRYRDVPGLGLGIRLACSPATTMKAWLSTHTFMTPFDVRFDESWRVERDRGFINSCPLSDHDRANP